MTSKDNKEKEKLKEKFIFASMDPVMFGDWSIKASSCNHGGVLIIMSNIKKLQCVTRYFDDEYQANIFITMVLEKSSTMNE